MMKSINQKEIKSLNIKKLYSLIQEHEQISRAKLAKITKLSKATVSVLIDELITNQFVMDCGQAKSNLIGRKPNVLMIDGTHKHVAVFHWHKSRIHASLISLDGKVVFEKFIPMEKKADYPQVTAQALREDLEKYNPQVHILGVCIIVPAIIDKEEQKIFSTVLKKEIMVSELQSIVCDYPVTVLNDTACYAYAEYVNNKMNGKYFAFLNISRGVGAVLLDHGKMFRGANGMTTQFGHYSIDRSGPLCDCGNRGCLECIIGEEYIYKRANEWKLADLFLNEEEATFRNLEIQMKKGNEKAVNLLEILAENTAYAISNLISLFNPQEIVFGGLCVVLGEPFLELCRKNLENLGFKPFTNNVKLRLTLQDKYSALIGAARYYIDQYFSFDGENKKQIHIG